MVGDKGTRRKRLRTPPERVQRLLTFGIYAASLEVPQERRAVEMVEGLEWLIDLLHRNGYAAPLWLLRPKWYFSRGVEIRDPERERPTSELMLELVEGIVADLPEPERQDGMREVLHLFAGIYAQGGKEPPEWLRLGLDRYGEDEGEELPVDLMLDVIDASLLNLPEESRPEARRDVLEHFAKIFTRRGYPVPEWVRAGLDGTQNTL
jgi:hypothetical protein